MLVGIRDENINIALRFYVMKTQLHVHLIMFFVSKYRHIWFPKTLSCCFGNFDLNHQTWSTLIAFSFSRKLMKLYKIIALCELHIHLNISATPRYSWIFLNKNNNRKKVDLVASEKSLVSLSTIENYLSVTLKSYDILAQCVHGSNNFKKLMAKVKLGRTFRVSAFFNCQFWKCTTLKINSLERELFFLLLVKSSQYK